jgi:UDP-glucose:(heptosyl)LPS alpha-1,3-glucosyltransferase
MRILYIVRTFGPVGGMERFVFETASQMALRGHDVRVLCRTVDSGVLATKITGLHATLLNPKAGRRGWQDRVFFARAVSEYFQGGEANRNDFDIIHSHENAVEQNVSTEHGPCTLAGLLKAPWKFCDYSALRNLMLERIKFSAPDLRALVSCSDRVQTTLLRTYPKLRSKSCSVIAPAYGDFAVTPVRRSVRPPTLGFMGFDWKRKGLPKVVEVFRCLKAEDPRWQLLVAGCDPSVLPNSLIRRAGEGAFFLGRRDPLDFFSSIDVLLHPAREEPFGMVVAEALSSDVPAVVSDQCGCIAHLRSDGLRVLPADAAPAAWTPACRQLIGVKIKLQIGRRDWSNVADEHESLYERVLAG